MMTLLAGRNCGVVRVGDVRPSARVQGVWVKGVICDLSASKLCPAYSSSRANL